MSGEAEKDPVHAGAALADMLAGLAELSEHLARAQSILGLNRAEDDATRDEDHSQIHAVLAVAQAALQNLHSFVCGQHFPSSGSPRLALKRTPSGVTVFADAAIQSESGRSELSAFIATIRQTDEFLLRSAELLGLLLGLCARWTAAGFSAPLLLLSLKKNAARILSLGQELGSSTPLLLPS